MSTCASQPITGTFQLDPQDPLTFVYYTDNAARGRATVATFEVADPTGYGRIVEDADGTFRAMDGTLRPSDFATPGPAGGDISACDEIGLLEARGLDVGLFPLAQGDVEVEIRQRL